MPGESLRVLKRTPLQMIDNSNSTSTLEVFLCRLAALLVLAVVVVLAHRLAVSLLLPHRVDLTPDLLTGTVVVRSLGIEAHLDGTDLVVDVALAELNDQDGGEGEGEEPSNVINRHV